MPVTFSAITNSNDTGFCKQIGNIFWVLRWYGSHTNALLRLVGSRHILSLRYPCLSLSSTNTKLLIQGVAWFTGFKTSTCNILSISFLKASFEWTGIGWQGVCFGVSLGSTWIWYGIPLWLDTLDSFFETWTLILDLVFLGWSTLLVIRLALGGR